jgi:hypothetical protein
MARKTGSPAGVIATAAPVQSSVEPVLRDVAATAQIDRRVLHQATERLADAQAVALLPYANGTALNAMVADRLASMLGGGVRPDYGEVGNIIDVFATECDGARLALQETQDSAVAFLSGYVEQSAERLDDARLILNQGEHRAIAPAASPWGDSEGEGDG